MPHQEKDEFQRIQDILSNWPPTESVDPKTFDDPLINRVANALRGLQTGTGSVPGSLDLAVLVRHLIRHNSLRKKKPDFQLSIPIGENWPDAQELESVGLRMTSLGTSALVSARPWEPDWLNGDTPAKAVFSGDIRLKHERVKADGIVRGLTGYKENLSPGQREAVRAAFFLKGGHSLLVNLPTGAGKSLAFQAPAIQEAKRQRLSLIVVPTTSLALSHEQRLRQWVSGPLAYHSGMSDDERKSFRGRIRSGDQKIVITSPESAIWALRPSLLQLAEQDRVAWFIIDEAHVLSDWGNEFRPEFQLLAGLRDGLLKASSHTQSSLRTMLLSATIDADAYTTMKHLFGSKTFHSVSAVHIRPEPEYWTCRIEDPEQKNKRIEEAVRHLPRPLILYTTEREHAQEWYNRLSGLGFQRLDLIRGGDLYTERGRGALKRWENRETDLIVANSAFGLGVDQADVRSVVHACVPETIHRYYQEVGRGGRDGKASFSLVVYNRADERTAEGLGSSRIIGLEKGSARWEAMWRTREKVEYQGEDDDIWTVDLEAQPTRQMEQNEANIAWNKRTLILLARSGIISLEIPSLVKLEQDENETDSDFEARQDVERKKTYTQAAFNLITAPTSETWDTVIAANRERTRKADQQSIDAMKYLLEGDREFNDVFREAYTLRDLGVTPNAPPGFCPVTRRKGYPSNDYGPPTPVVDFSYRPEVTGYLGQRVSEGEPFLITYDYPIAPATKAMIVELIRKSVDAGVCEIAVPDNWQGDSDLRRLESRGPHQFVIIQNVMEPDELSFDQHTTTHLVLPKISLLEQDQASDIQVQRSLTNTEANALFHMVLLPRDTPDRDHLGRLYGVSRYSTQLDAFLSGWGFR